MKRKFFEEKTTSDDKIISEGEDSIVSDPTDYSEYNLNKLQSTSRFLGAGLRSLLFCVNIDPFAIYKTGSIDQRAIRQRGIRQMRIHQSPQLRMSTNENDLAREKFNFYLNLIGVYFAIKLSILGLAQAIVYNHTGFSELDYRARNHSIVIDSLINLAKIIGDPIGAMTGISIAVLVIAIMGILNLFAYIPYYYHKKPPDAPNIRFMLDPLKELKRMDICAIEVIERMLVSLENFSELASFDLRAPTKASCILHRCAQRNDVTMDRISARIRRNYRFNDSNNSNSKDTTQSTLLRPSIEASDGQELHLGHHSHLRSNLTKIDQEACNSTKKIFEELKQRVWLMRPASHSAEWLVELYRACFKLEIFLALLAISVGSLTFIILLNGAFTANCHLNRRNLLLSAKIMNNSSSNSTSLNYNAGFQPSTCFAESSFTLADWFMFFEINLALWTMGAVVVMQIIMVTTNSLCQIEVIQGLQEDLRFCIRVIEYSNHHGENPINVTNDFNKFKSPRLSTASLTFFSEYQSRHSTIVSAAKDRSTSISTSCTKNNSLLVAYKNVQETKNMVFDTLLLRILVKLKVCENEFKKNTAFITEIIQSFLCMMGTVIFVTLLAGRFHGETIGLLKQNALIFAWVANNILLIIWSHTFARTVKLEKISWSLLAQIQVRLKQTNRNCMKDFVSMSWQKEITGGSLSDSRNSVRPFGMSITYERAIEFNFVVVSLASLMRTV